MLEGFVTNPTFQADRPLPPPLQRVKQRIKVNSGKVKMLGEKMKACWMDATGGAFYRFFPIIWRQLMRFSAVSMPSKALYRQSWKSQHITQGHRKVEGLMRFWKRTVPFSSAYPWVKRRYVEQKTNVNPGKVKSCRQTF